jgi:hypothetical protein
VSYVKDNLFRKLLTGLCVEVDEYYLRIASEHCLRITQSTLFLGAFKFQQEIIDRSLCWGWQILPEDRFRTLSEDHSEYTVFRYFQISTNFWKARQILDLIIYILKYWFFLTFSSSCLSMTSDNHETKIVLMCWSGDSDCLPSYPPHSERCGGVVLTARLARVDWFFTNMI